MDIVKIKEEIEKFINEFFESKYDDHNSKALDDFVPSDIKNARDELFNVIFSQYGIELNGIYYLNEEILLSLIRYRFQVLKMSYLLRLMNKNVLLKTARNESLLQQDCQSYQKRLNICKELILIKYLLSCGISETEVLNIWGESIHNKDLSFDDEELERAYLLRPIRYVK